MRNILTRYGRIMAVCAATFTFIQSAQAQAGDFVVTILGSGAPTLNPERFSQSTLVEAGDAKLLFDAGRGAILRLKQAGVSPAQVTDVFFTHYHSDHLTGFADFWLTSWLPAGGGRTTPLNVTGPTGVVALTEGLKAAFAADVAIRIADQDLPPEGAALKVAEFDAEGVVFDEGGVTVTAFEVDHGDEIKPSFGYRVDYDGRSVVFSSDTRKSANVVKYATDADLLIHEVATASPSIAATPVSAAILAHHTSPREAGEVFAAAHPKLAAYSHFVIRTAPGDTPPTVEDILAETREVYDGPLVAGEDLMTFTIADTVEVGTRKTP